jgi:RNA polymerase sigma-70 factor (ECF subfamily)
MQQLARGERDALGPLMERHHRRLFRIALSYLRDVDEAMDAVQETFVKAYQAASRWDPVSEVGPWLSRIAVNHSIDCYRRRRRRQRSEGPMPDDTSDHDSRWRAADPSPESEASGREVGHRIAAALRTLPERQRTIFVLRHYGERSLPEIADSLGMSLGTVKSSLHRAIARLRERLGSASA